MNPIPGANTSTTSDGSGVATDPWLKLAQDAYSRSTTYFDNNYKKKWENDLRMFQSRHPADSKYNSELYKHRSRIFRPKSRSVLRKNEATAALAFFSNPDVTSMEPGNPDNLEQVASAVLMKEVVQYRLTKTIPWFLISIGAFQDAMKIGLVCSLQHWRYRQKMVKQTQTGYTMDGMPVNVEVDVPKVLEDKPSIDLFPLENVRFDPGAQWYNVAGTSPYLILQIPMYVNDVLDNMETADRAGDSWKRLEKAQILQARVKDDDSLRSARVEGKENPATVQSDVNEFDIVMVHLNFIRQGHEMQCFYSLEDKHLLTDPVPLDEMFPHCKDGEPPVVIGFCVIETHTPMPASLIGLTSELQREANEIANSRLDNVKLVLNKRTLFRRGANVDIEGWMRNVPGAAILVNDVEKDAKPIEYQDVTSSSFQEQDRVNVDFDELAGNFAQGSVMTNRKLNETVGGMRMMAQGANMLTEYTLRVFVETWAEPVLRQLTKMEQTYETDEVVLNFANGRAQLYQKFGTNFQLDSLLNQELTLNVNVGMGATDPDTRFQRLMQAFGAYAKMVMEGPPDINLPEYRKEIFGLAGFKDAARFFSQIDPRLEHAKKMLAGAQKQAEDVVLAAKERMQSRERSLDEREHELDMKELEIKYDFEAEMRKLMAEFQLKERESMHNMAIKLAESQANMQMKREAAVVNIDLKELQAKSDAMLEEFKAKVEAAIKIYLANMQAQAKAQSEPKKKTAKKRSDGTWEITEVSTEVKH